VRTGDEALRRQVEHLERLRGAARAAATREAATILATARAEIRRIITDARSRLLALKTQLEEIVEPGSELDAALAALRPDVADDDLAVLIAEDGDVPESVRQVRRDLQRLLGDDRPDPLPAPGALVGTSAHPAATEAVVPPSSAQRPEFEPDHRPATRMELFASSAHVGDPERSRSGSKRVLTLLAVVVAIGAGVGGGWWVLAERSAAFPGASIPSVPRPKAPSAPADDAEIPTLTASLIALPLPTTEHADPAPTSAPSGPLTLDVEVRRAVWMRVSIDDAPTAGRMFQPGAPLRFSAARTVAITVGDGGAVAVSMNGGPSAVVGRDGQVVNRRFAASSPSQR
jgi:uncharacterized protein DUF4115